MKNIQKSSPILNTALAFVAAAALALGALMFAPNANAQWGGAGLFTEEGVEVAADARVFTLFALLNANGFDEESFYGPAPLKRPLFSKARTDFRSKLNRARRSEKDFAQVVAENEGSISKYLRSALSLSAAPEFKKAKKGPKLAKKIRKSMKAWYNKDGGAPSYRAYAAEARKSQKTVLKALAPLTKKIAMSVRLGDEEDELIEESGPQRRASVVVNELDAFGTVRRIVVKDDTYIVSGAVKDGADAAKVAQAGALAYARASTENMVRKSVANSEIAKAFAALDKGDKKGFDDAADFASEAVACALLMNADAKATCRTSSLTKREKAMALVKGIQAKIAASDAAKELAKAAIPKWLGAGS